MDSPVNNAEASGTTSERADSFRLPSRREYQAQLAQAAEKLTPEVLGHVGEPSPEALTPAPTPPELFFGVPQAFDAVPPVKVRNREVPSRAVIISAIVLTVVVLSALLTLLFYYSAEEEPANFSQSARIQTAFDVLNVSGRVGATPVVELEQPITVAGTKERVYVEGTGRTITDESPVLIAVTAFDGNTGQVLNPSGQPRLQVGYANSTTFHPELLKAVVGHNEGSRVVVIRHLAPDALAEDATCEFEIDVVDILPSVVMGVEQPGANGQPLHVEIAEAGPRISHGEELPAGLKTQVIIKGEGAQVRATDSIVAQFILANWSDGIVKESTWDRGLPQLIDLPTAMPGLVEALADQRVGSRIAVTIPPDKATGEDTMVAVIDILGSTSATLVSADSAQSVQ